MDPLLPNYSYLSRVLMVIMISSQVHVPSATAFPASCPGPLLCFISLPPALQDSMLSGAECLNQRLGPQRNTTGSEPPSRCVHLGPAISPQSMLRGSIPAELPQASFFCPYAETFVGLNAQKLTATSPINFSLFLHSQSLSFCICKMKY